MELLEKVSVAVQLDLKNNEKCPFCYEKPVGHATDKPKKVTDKVTSVPKDLQCTNDTWRDGTADKRPDGDLPYTLAQHHLISAMQCYARIRRLVRMGNLVGYDINNPKNGIGLPTTHWHLKYPTDEGPQKYGALDDPEGKSAVADALMKELGAQWHVGHHAFTVGVPKSHMDDWNDGDTEEKEETGLPHETAYDVVIIGRLLQLAMSFEKEFCEDPERDEKFKENMNALSKEIKDKLSKFNQKDGAKPKDSSPLFVSLKAYQYSGVEKELPNKDLPGNKKSKKKTLK